MKQFTRVRFSSGCPIIAGDIAQLVELWIEDPGIAGVRFPLSPHIARSSSGRTPDFESGNRSSNLLWATKKKYLYITMESDKFLILLVLLII